MLNYILTIEYDGTNYSGIQKQHGNSLTIYEILETAAKRVLGDDIHEIQFCGRTDAGVHAVCMTANIKTTSFFKEGKLAMALNFYLKKEQICVLNSKEVSLEFNARYSAKQRSYIYKILNRPMKSPLLYNRVWFIPSTLDVEAMKAAAAMLKGQHDFQFFQSLGCASASSTKTIDKIEVTKNFEIIEIQISAKSFLYKMVRNIVGFLVEIGKGNLKLEELEIILQKNLTRKEFKEVQAAPACGLYFVEAIY
jgi:tRNA pseudouridine38-40 synthase